MKRIAYWVRYSRIEAGRTVGRGKVIVCSTSPAQAIEDAADVLMTKGLGFNTRITSAKPKA